MPYSNRQSFSAKACVLSGVFICLLFALMFAGCQQLGVTRPIPTSMSQVRATGLAYRFEPDVASPNTLEDNADENLASIRKDFETRRVDDALVRTVVSPDGQRVMVLYETGENEPGEYRVDLYSPEGTFLRNVTPPEFGGSFATTASWSPDSKYFVFAGRKALKPTPIPTPAGEEAPPTVLPTPAPQASVAPAFSALAVYETEQMYICDSDGFDLKPLTNRPGLIYFNFEWSPDGRALTALACKENEFDAREKERRMPQGRPRIVGLDGQERLLDDALTEAVPVWSPDGTKVATAFDSDVKVYDSAGSAPTQAVIPLQEAMLSASRQYDTKLPGKNGSSDNDAPLSFNPIVKLDWPEDKTLYVKTAFVRNYAEPVNDYQRWHAVHLSPQAALMGQTKKS